MYYVVLQDGQKFGPADLNLLNQWVAEGRILGSTILENAQTGQRIPASSMPGLQVADAGQAQPYQPPYQPPGTMNAPQPYAGYYRGPVQGQMGDYGQSDITAAWIFGALGLAPCVGGGGCAIFGIVFAILGLVFAKKAQEKGHPSANGAKILAGVALGLQVGVLLLMVVLLGFAS